MKATTKTHFLEIVEKVQSEVRLNPTRCLTLMEVARIASVSHIYLHKVFQEVVGENYGQYVRRIRLQKACSLMRSNKDWKLTKIAVAAGYSEGSDFTRSFKRMYGFPPSKWDRRKPLSDFLKNNKFCQDFIADLDTLSETENGRGGRFDLGRICLKRFPGMRLATLRIRQADDKEKLSRGFDKLESWLIHNAKFAKDRHYMGMSFDSGLDSSPNEYVFELAYEVDNDVVGSNDVVIRDLPEFDAAILECIGGSKEFTLAWDTLYRDYLPKSPYQQGDAPLIELYFNDPRLHDMAHWEILCVLPVTRKH